MVSTLSRTTVTERSAQQQEAIWRVMEELDLEPIVFKLTVSEHGDPPKMTLKEADHCVTLYRYFLVLNLLYPGTSIVPTKPLDEVWHTHILDTAKYREDCERIFGRTLDHFPYLGLRGEDDVRRWNASFARTCKLFEQHFGVMLVGDSAACGESCGSSLCDNPSCDVQSCTAPPSPPTDVIDRSRPRPDRTTAFV